ncbi:MAG: NUDIX hydrolase [Patescibacteria group bacterium]
MLKSRFPISAVFAITIVNEGFVLIHEANTRPPVLWKNVGGRLEKPTEDDVEIELEGIKREFEEETKKKLPRNKFEEFTVVDVERGNYSILFYVVDIPEVSFTELRKGDEVEEMKFVSRKQLQEMISMRQLVGNHAKALQEYLEATEEE